MNVLKALAALALLAVTIQPRTCNPTPPPPPPTSPAANPQILASQLFGTLGGALNVTDDGAAAFTLPLRAPPGRAGVMPQLSLVYSSRGENGLLGVGWSLAGLSAIVRCGSDFARDGQNRPVWFNAQDHYCLDGQRLIPNADGSEYGPSPTRSSGSCPST